MKTEQEWIDELEREAFERLAKKDLCQALEVDWSENLGRFSIDQLREQIELRRDIAKKYGQKVRAEHIDKPLEEYERCISNIGVREMTIPGKYSLRQSSKILGIPISYLNHMRLKGVISCEQIERSYYFCIDVLKKELKSPAA